MFPLAQAAEAYRAKAAGGVPGRVDPPALTRRESGIPRILSG